jgi:hypothetical protein
MGIRGFHGNPIPFKRYLRTSAKDRFSAIIKFNEYRDIGEPERLPHARILAHNGNPDRITFV